MFAVTISISKNRHQNVIFKFSNIDIFSASVFALNTASININNDVNETYMTHGENLLNIQNWISGKIIIASYSLVKKYINLRMHLRLHTQFSQSNSNINEIHVNIVLIYIKPHISIKYRLIYNILWRFVKTIFFYSRKTPFMTTFGFKHFVLLFQNLALFCNMY